MQKITLFLLAIVLFNCKKNKDLKTAVLEKKTVSEKIVQNDSVTFDFLSSEKKLWYQFNELPFATYSGDQKKYYEVYFFAKNKNDYELNNKLEESSNDEIKSILKNQSQFYKIVFLTKSSDIEKATENGETNYYPKFPSFKYIYLYDDYNQKWSYVKKILYKDYDQNKIDEIQKIIQNYILQRLSSKLVNKSLENWRGTYSWDYDEGKNAANYPTLSSYSLIIKDNNISYSGMGYQVDFKYSCLFENKGDTLNIYEYKNLQTNKKDLNIFPLQLFTKEKKYFTYFLGLREIMVKK